MDHIIELMQEIISSSLIPEKPQDYTLIQEYLNKMLRKESIRISKSNMKASIFLIFKKERK